MTLFAQLILYGWIPIVLMMFLVLPPRRALVVATVSGWLTLPNVVVVLSGIPDYSKTSATIVGLLLGSALFDPGRIFTFRPRWIDLPMIVFCICPFFTSLSNELGAYDGVSGMLDMTMYWGLPYFLGRVYLADLTGLRDLAVAIVIGGLIYVPFCLFEIRFSPQLQNWLYGSSLYWEGTRWGGYRPKVLLATGIELGMWMTASSLAGYWLWRGKALTQLWGWRFGVLLSILMTTTVLCKSTGALVLLLVGIAAHWVVRRTKSPLPILVLALLPSFYVALRAPGLLSGKPLVAVATTLFGDERASSLHTRLYSEDKLAAKALQRPLLGWGGFNRGVVYDETGRTDVFLDGFWIIILGRLGLIGLASLLLAFLLPIALFLRRFPARGWTTPAVAPAAALAVLLSLYIIDCLTNAFMNLAYAISVGGLAGLVTARKGAPGTEPAAGQGRGVAAVPADPRPEIADRQDASAELSWVQGRYDEAEGALQLARKIREEVANDHPDVPEFRRDLALALENLGRLLKVRGRTRDAADAWHRAAEIREVLAAEFPEDHDSLRRWANICNDLAWLLVAHRDPAPEDAADAIHLAERAVEMLPGMQAYWNTLGMAHYRGGNWEASAVALKKSIELDSGGSGFDHFVLAMALRRLGHDQQAVESFNRACRWLQEHNSGHADLLRLRDEAARVLGI